MNTITLKKKIKPLTTAGCALETVIDKGFVTEKIISTINQVVYLKGQFDIFFDIVNKSMDKFY